MQKIIRTILITLTALFFVSNANALDYETVSAQLNNHHSLECDYKQVKTIQGNVLESAGHLLLENKNHIVYTQLDPFEMSLEITPDRITQNIEGEIEEINRESNAKVFEVSNLLLKVFCADGNLKEYFDYTIDGTKDKWTATLTPHHELLSKIFSKIVMSGSDRLDEVEIDDKQGDKTSISFFNYTFKD